METLSKEETKQKKLGQYEINRLYNEDCYEAILKIPDKSIDLIYTDPPYLFYKGNHKNPKSRVAKNAARKNAQINNISDGFDYSILDEYCRVLKHIYIHMV